MSEEKTSYDSAVKEIEEILDLIEKGELGIDALAEKVKRVKLLLSTCREKLYSTEQEIASILGKEEDSPES